VSNFIQALLDNLTTLIIDIFISEKRNMFTAEQYRAKAIEYSKLLRIANGPIEARECQRLERSFIELADNAQWAADNYDKTVHARGRGAAVDTDQTPA
jgi:hypothetical protein